MYSKRNRPLCLVVLLACTDCSAGARNGTRAGRAERPNDAASVEGGPFAAFPCAPGSTGDSPPELELRHRGDALRPVLELDYLAVRRLVRTTWSQLASIAQRGTACERATQPAACIAALEQLDARFANEEGARCPGLECPGFTYVLTTRGDEAAVWSTPAELRRLLGPIDTPAEAWLMAQVAVRAGPYLCGEDEFAAHRSVAGGFELRERRYTRACHPVELSEIVYRVTTDGLVKASPRSVVRSDPNGCASSGDDVRGEPGGTTGRASGSTDGRPSAAP